MIFSHPLSFFRFVFQIIVPRPSGSGVHLNHSYTLAYVLQYECSDSVEEHDRSRPNFHL